MAKFITHIFNGLRHIFKDSAIMARILTVHNNLKSHVFRSKLLLLDKRDREFFENKNEKEIAIHIFIDCATFARIGQNSVG